MDTKPNQKLLDARTEIEAVLRKHDIAAHVTLWSPGPVEDYLENFSNYDEPSFSALQKEWIDAHGYKLHLRSKLADYNGDKEARMRDLRATCGMLRGIAEVLASEAIALIKASEHVDQLVGVDHTPIRPI